MDLIKEIERLKEENKELRKYAKKMAYLSVRKVKPRQGDIIIINVSGRNSHEDGIVLAEAIKEHWPNAKERGITFVVSINATSTISATKMDFGKILKSETFKEYSKELFKDRYFCDFAKNDNDN